MPRLRLRSERRASDRYVIDAPDVFDLAPRDVAAPDSRQVERATSVEAERRRRRNATRSAVGARVESLSRHVDGCAHPGWQFDLSRDRARGEQTADDHEQHMAADEHRLSVASLSLGVKPPAQTMVI